MKLYKDELNIAFTWKSWRTFHLSLENNIFEKGEHDFVLHISDEVRPSFSVVSNTDIAQTQPVNTTTSDIIIGDVGQSSTTQGKNCNILFLNKHANLTEMLTIA